MSIHDGHRNRLMDKIKKGGVLHEHEYLEALLFASIPRRNTNDIAHRLLAEFGSIPNVLSASVEQLQRVDGIGLTAATNLNVVGHFCQMYFSTFSGGYAGTYDSEKFFAYVREKYKKETVETFDVYFLTSDNTMMGAHSFTSDKPHTVSFEPEEFAQLLVERMPAGIVLVHNHPIGEAKPSSKDDETTKHCQIICNAHNVLLCDHVVYGNDGVFSYYSSGRLREIARNVLAATK